jgi:hypothetical protein
MHELPENLPATSVTVLQREHFQRLLGPRHLVSYQPPIGEYMWLLLADWRLVIGDIADHSTLLKLFRETGPTNLLAFRETMVGFSGEARDRFVAAEFDNVLFGGICDGNGDVIHWYSKAFKKADTKEGWKPDLQSRVKNSILHYFHEEEVTSGKTLLPTPSPEKP